MTQLHFRDLRRRVDRLEDRYLPPRPITVVFEFLDEDGNAEVFESFVVGDPASESGLGKSRGSRDDQSGEPTEGQDGPHRARAASSCMSHFSPNLTSTTGYYFNRRYSRPPKPVCLVPAAAKARNCSAPTARTAVSIPT